MDKIQLEPTEFTPGINFDPANNIYKMWGMSRPEDLAAFYFPLTEWWNEFLEFCIKNKEGFANKEINLDINIEYFNSASSKMIYDIIDIGKSLNSHGIPYSVNWYYQAEDEDIYESGIELAKELHMEFKMISIE